MESAADALKIAFGIFVFIIALSVTLNLVTQAKETADIVSHYSDQTNWYQYNAAPSENISVTNAEVVSSLYSINGENIDITIILGSNVYRFNSQGYYKNNTKKNTFKTNSDLKNEISKFISNDLTNGKYEVKCQEIKVSGVYDYGSDGTEIIKSQGGTKLYITYTKVS